MLPTQPVHTKLHLGSARGCCLPVTQKKPPSKCISIYNWICIWWVLEMYFKSYEKALELQSIPPHKRSDWLGLWDQRYWLHSSRSRKHVNLYNNYTHHRFTHISSTLIIKYNEIPLLDFWRSQKPARRCWRFLSSFMKTGALKLHIVWQSSSPQDTTQTPTALL